MHFGAGKDNMKRHHDRKEKIISEWENSSTKSDTPLEEIHDTYKEFFKEDNDIDDMTWNDLEMDEFFMKNNTTLTNPGELMLYRVLRKPIFDGEVLLERDYFVDLFMKNKALRDEKLVELSALGENRGFFLLHYNHIDTASTVSVIKNIMIPLCLFISFFMCFVHATGILLFIVLFIINCICYYHDKRHIEAELYSMREIGSLLSAMAIMEFHCGEERLDPMQLENQLS